MIININGNPTDLESDCTVRDLLDRCGLGGAACAVEVNRSLVPRRQHESHRLAAGDTVEVVTLVGGG